MEARKSQTHFNLIETDTDLSVLYVGYDACLPQHHSSGIRNHFLLHYVREGKGKVILNDREYILGAGAVFLIFPKQYHFYQADSDEPWTYSWIGLSGTKVESLFSEANFTKEKSVYSREYKHEIGKCFDTLRETIQNKKHGFTIKTRGIVYQIFALLIEEAEFTPSPQSKSPKKESHIKKAINFIEVNYQQINKASQLAEYTGLDRTYFTSLFTEYTGRSPGEYLREYRIKKAQELLVKTDYTIGDIAQSVGYNDYFRFAKRFKQITGITPTQYRKRK